MRRGSEVVGKPIVSAVSGDKVGKVADLLLDESSSRIVGLVVGGGLMSSEHVLPYGDVQAIGRDAVVARSQDGMVSPREWEERGVRASRSSALMNKRVMTSTGRAVGSVKDIYLDERTGAIQGYDLAGPALAGLMERRTMLPHSGQVTVGPDALVVSDGSAESLDPGR